MSYFVFCEREHRFRSDHETVNASLLKGKYLTSTTGSGKVNSVIEKRNRILLNLDFVTLVIPNAKSARTWCVIAQAEFSLFQFLQGIRLFAIQPQIESLFVGEKWQETFSYPSLNQLQSKGIYLLDLNYDKRSSWKNSKLTFFNNDRAAFNPQNWDPIFAPMLDDIAKLIVYGLPPDFKSTCLAVIHDKGNFTIRFMVQERVEDRIQVPNGSYLVDPNPLKWNDLVKKTLESSIRAVLTCEFQKFSLNDEETVLLNHLVTRYTQIVFEEARKIYAGAK